MSEQTSAAQLVHGLRLAGDVPIPGAELAQGGDLDFQIETRASAVVPEEAPEGELVAALELSGSHYAATLAGDVLRARFFGAADFEVDLTAGRIAATPAPGREAMLPLLLGGNVLALVLGMRGAAVLHASAATLGGPALAIAGPSGAGKSTVAALLCAAGAELVSDDTARLEQRGEEEVLVHHGPAEIRLRGPAAVLAGSLGDEARTTPDGRVAAQVPPATGTTTALGSVAFPSWSEATERPRVVPLGPRDALSALLASSRVAGWRAPGPLRANFEGCAALARRRPAFRVELPRDRLADPHLPAALREALEAAGALPGPPTPPKSLRTAP